MGAFSFNQFNRATKPELPSLVAAETAQAQLDSQAKARADSLRSGNMLGAAGIYNKAMGDKTPIADWLGIGGEAGTAGEAAAAAAEIEAAKTAAGVVPEVASAVTPEIANAMAATEVAGSTAIAPAAAGAGAGAGPLAALGPYGVPIALALAMYSMNQ